MDLLGWLNDNSGAVTGVATVAGVAVATAYSVFAALQWRATSRQAEITQAMFEASHRPYLNVLPQSPVFYDRHIQFIFHLENRGTVPAIVTGWHVSVRYRDQAVPIEPRESREVVRVVFPGGHERLGLVQVGEPDGLRDAGQLMIVTASVGYHGVGARQFSTQIVMDLFATQQVTGWDCREVRLDS